MDTLTGSTKAIPLPLSLPLSGEMSSPFWHQWYDGLSRRQKLRYHVNVRASRLTDWLLRVKSPLINYDVFWNIFEFGLERQVPCFLLGHGDYERGYYIKGEFCVYCGKEKK